MATTQESANKATFRRFHDAFANGGDARFISSMIDEIAEPDVKNHTPVEATGAHVLKELFARAHQVFPDLHVTVEDMIEEGDKVVGRNTLTGTHQGEYMGLAPTGKTITYDEIIILRFVNGRVAETWGIVNVFSQLKQLGLFSAGEAAISRPG
jgi:predicted ester cyclase